ncbi:hypothetical protein [Thermogymnomonas acidicola]|uniref:hypothetical protein n=1 Tax=Thermogymnomonas acidicola TaxID=399579 RepID=UPI00139676D4|nr:hypothetical protein [Thermogymnomonas acidicola]
MQSKFIETLGYADVAQEKQITPWEVQGGELTDTDYQKVAREFGAKIIDPELTEMIRSAAGEVHPYITNGTFFAHRDLDMLLSDYRSGKRFYLYTGRGGHQARCTLAT